MKNGEYLKAVDNLKRLKIVSAYLAADSEDKIEAVMSAGNYERENAFRITLDIGSKVRVCRAYIAKLYGSNSAQNTDLHYLASLVAYTDISQESVAALTADTLIRGCYEK